MNELGVRRFAWLAWLIAALAGSGACATAGASADAGYKPPKMVPSSAPNPMQISGELASWTGADVTIAGLVDSAGKPQMSTLQLAGRGGVENRDAILHWIRSARYVPAQWAGRAVEGTFQTRIRARSSRTRRG